MAKSINIGVSGVKKRVKSIYIGAGGVKKKVKRVYIGSGGLVKMVYTTTTISVGTTTALSIARQNMASASVGNYLLFAGGTINPNTDASDVNQIKSTIDVYSNTLVKTTASLSNGVHHHAGASIGNYALFAGGIRFGAWSNIVEGFNSSLVGVTVPAMDSPDIRFHGTNIGTSYAVFLTSNATYAYNTSLVKTTVPYMPTGWHNWNGASVGNYALFFGGYSASNSSTINHMYSVNTSLVASSFVVDMNSTYQASASNGTYAMFTGGRYLDGSNVTNKTIAVNSSLTVSYPTVLSEAKSFHSGISLGENAVFGGGLTSAGAYSNVVESYDQSLLKTTFALSVGRYSLSGGKVGNYGIFAGGIASGSVVSAVADVYEG